MQCFCGLDGFNVLENYIVLKHQMGRGHGVGQGCTVSGDQFCVTTIYHKKAYLLSRPLVNYSSIIWTPFTRTWTALDKGNFFLSRVLDCISLYSQMPSCDISSRCNFTLSSASRVCHASSRPMVTEGWPWPLRAVGGSHRQHLTWPQRVATCHGGCMVWEWQGTSGVSLGGMLVDAWWAGMPGVPVGSSWSASFLLGQDGNWIFSANSWYFYVVQGVTALECVKRMPSVPSLQHFLFF